MEDTQSVGLEDLFRIRFAHLYFVFLGALWDALCISIFKGDYGLCLTFDVICGGNKQ